MLVFGTEMHIITFLFICLETAIICYLLIYRLARPDDTTAYLDVVLISLLLTYNISGGLLPDGDLPGSFFLQESIAYGTGFITPCFFPFYVYKGFDLKAMKFHAFKGVYLFLCLPYLLFIIIFYATKNINTAKNLLIIPVLYAIWVLISVKRAVRIKYFSQPDNNKKNEEVIVLFISLFPWVGLPLIAYFDLSQVLEATATNTGFLLLLALHLKRNILRLKEEHARLIKSEKALLSWNDQLQQEVEKRSRELELISRDSRIKNNCKAHNLTNRETEIALLICKGIVYKQIGEDLFIAERTVAKHAQNIFEKVRVSNKIELCTKLEEAIGSIPNLPST